jgi:hypothetical protein
MKQAQNGSEQLAPDTEITIHDFVSHLPSRRYIFIPNGEPWPASAVNLRVEPQGKMAASTWLDRHRAVEAMSWVPGEPMLIHNRLVSGDGIIERKDVVTFNLYRPATIPLGRPDLAQPWLANAGKAQFGAQRIETARNAVTAPHQATPGKPWGSTRR